MKGQNETYQARNTCQELTGKQVWKSRTLQRLGENWKGQEKQVKSYFGDGKCGRGEWQEKNCYEESNHNAEQLCAAPCHTVLVVHVAAAGPTELTAQFWRRRRHASVGHPMRRSVSVFDTSRREQRKTAFLSIIHVFPLCLFFLFITM